MYIEKETLFLIGIIVAFVINMIFHIITLVKFHNLKSSTPLTVDDVLTNIIKTGRDLLTQLLDPENSIVDGLRKWLGNAAKGKDDKDGTNNG